MFASPGPFVLQIGPLSIRWYGLLFATGVLLGTGWRSARRSDGGRILISF